MEKLSKEKQVQELRDLALAGESSFYRSLWKSDPSTPLTLEHLQKIPLKDRSYRHGLGFVRIIHLEIGHVLSKILKSVAKLPFDLSGERPFIMCADEQLSLELLVRTYGEGRLPLLGETRLARSSLTAGKTYGVDTALCDAAGALVLLSNISTSPITKLRTLSILTEGFPDQKVFEQVSKTSKNLAVNWYLSLPETGMLGNLCLTTKRTAFLHEGEKIHLHEKDGTLLVDTLDGALAAPLICYKTRIQTSPLTSCEACGKSGYQIFENYSR